MNKYREQLNWHLQGKDYSGALIFNLSMQTRNPDNLQILLKHEQELRTYIQLNQPEETA